MGLPTPLASDHSLQSNLLNVAFELMRISSKSHWLCVIEERGMELACNALEHST